MLYVLELLKSYLVMFMALSFSWRFSSGFDSNLRIDDLYEERAIIPNKCFCLNFI